MAASTKDQCGPKEKNKQNFVPIVKCQTLGNNPAQKKQTKKSAKAKPAKSYLKAPFTYEWLVSVLELKFIFKLLMLLYSL